MAVKPVLAHTPAAALAALEQLLDPAYPDDWREIATCLYVQLRARDEIAPFADPRVAQLALELTEGLRAEIGGNQTYHSKGVRYDLSLRDRQILAEFTGRNHDALAKKHGLTPRQMYNILEVRLREEFERRQGSLPLESPES